MTIAALDSGALICQDDDPRLRSAPVDVTGRAAPPVSPPTRIGITCAQEDDYLEREVSPV